MMCMEFAFHFEQPKCLSENWKDTLNKASLPTLILFTYGRQNNLNT